MPTAAPSECSERASTERGATISEFPLRTHPAPENSPCEIASLRMPLGVVVVEGAQLQRVADHRAPGHGVRQRSLRRAGNVSQPVVSRRTSSSSRARNSPPAPGT